MSTARWDQVKSLFHAAMELPAPERGAFLETQCKGDAALRQEVDSLLAARTQEFVRTGGAAHALGLDDVGGLKDNGNTRSTMTHFAPITETPGTVIGPYKLLQVIGEGGFGTVFLAEQHQPVRRRVALKIIKLGMDTKSVVARFEAERQALALMEHPHIARVLDGGATDTGRPYFVMEYVVGDSITKFADAHSLTVNERLDLFQQVCSAVQHAHTKGIIHRDLKPGNVLVSMVDGKPFAKVIDFGIAKATAGVGGALTDKTLFTEHKLLIGTPEYMSPEQAEGSMDIDTRTDVYSLGVLLYELLTGTTPIDSTKLRSAAYDEMRRMIREDDPPMPSMKLSRSLDKLAATAAARKVEPARLSTIVKGELDWIVMKALEKERGRRYETANALGDDVRRHLLGEAVVAAPVSRAYRLRKFVKRNRGSVAAAGAVAAALFVGVAGTTLGLLQAQRATDSLTMQVEIAKQKLMKAASNYRGEHGVNAEIELFDESGRQMGFVAVEGRDDGITATLYGPGKMLDPNREQVTGVEAVSMLGQFAMDAAADAKRRTDELEQSNKSLNAQAAAVRAEAQRLVFDAVGIRDSENDQYPAFNQDGFIDGPRGPQTYYVNFGENGEVANWGLRAIEERDLQFSTNVNALVGIGRRSVLALRERSTQLLEANAIVERERDAAEWSAYTANLALSQQSIQTQNWPEARSTLSECPPGKRDWEWTLLNRLASAARVVVPFEAYSAVFSPDGRLVLAKSDSDCKLTDTDGNRHAEFPNGNRYVPAMFNPDGSSVLISPEERTLQFYSLDGHPIGNPVHHGDEVIGCVISPDGKRVLSWSRGTGTLWSPNGEVIQHDIEGVSRAVFSPDSKHFVVSDTSCRVYDDVGQPTSAALPSHQNAIAIFSADSKFVCIQVENSQLRWFDQNGVPVGNNMQHEGFVSKVVASADGTCILTCSNDARIGTVMELDMTPTIGSVVRVWDMNGNPLSPAIAGSLDSRYLAAGFSGDDIFVAEDHRIRFFSRTGQEKLRTLGIDRLAQSVRVTNAGSVLATSGDNLTTLRVWNNRGQDQGTFVHPEANAGGIEISPNGLVMMHSWSFGSGSARPAVIDPEYLDTRRNLSALELAVLTEVSEHGKSSENWRCSSTSESVEVWRNDIKIQTLRTRLSFPNAWALTMSGSRLLVGTPGRAIQFWDTGTWKNVATFSTDDEVTRLAFSSDGTRLIISLADGSARVWDIRDPAERRKDLEREWAERVPAGEYLDGLWNTPPETLPSDSIRDTIITDKSLTRLRRLVAAEMLEERLTDTSAAADEAFANIIRQAEKETQAWQAIDTVRVKSLIVSSASSADLPARVKEQVVKKAAEWKYEPPVVSDAEKLVDETKRRELAEAGLLLTNYLHQTPDGLEPIQGSSENFQKAYDIRKRILGSGDPLTLDAADMLGTVGFYDEQDYARLRESLDAYWQSGGTVTSRALAIQAELAAEDIALGRLEAARQLLQDVVSKCSQADQTIAFDLGRGERRYLCFVEERSTEFIDLSLSSKEQWDIFVDRVKFFLAPMKKHDLDSYCWWVAKKKDASPRERQLADWRSRSAYVREEDDTRTADQRRTFALAYLRNRNSNYPLTPALDCIVKAMQMRAAMPDDPSTAIRENAENPLDLVVLALVRWKMADQLSDSAATETGKAKVIEDHKAAARDALARARALMQPAVDGTPSPWADDTDAKALLAEAEALIGK